MATLTRRSLKIDIETPAVPHKIQKKSQSPRLGRQNGSSLQTYKITFEFGPPKLNLFRYITKKARILWKEANEKCILKDCGRPTDGLILICGDDETNIADCMKIIGFDVYQHEKLLGTESVITDQQESVCIFYFGEQILTTMKNACVLAIRDTIKKVSDANAFIMTTTDVERDEAIERCKRFTICPNSHVISPASDKTSFYEAFYKVLDKNLQTFSSDLETRTSTRQIHAIKSKLNSLIEKLRSRNVSMKAPLSKQCLELINASRKNGVVGYRLFGNELHIYGNDQLTIGAEKRLEIENSIKENFNGQVRFRSLGDVLIPQCNVKCGDYLKSSETGRKGTLGIFGEMKTAVENDSIQTIALSSAHVISRGEVACTSAGERFGECIWPGSTANIHDVSIIQIDPSFISTLQQTTFNEDIAIKEISKESLLYREVFKYGATTQKTCGSIEQIDHFNLFGSDVMTISSDDPERLFSTNGDSGAIVLTILDGKHHGIGVIYGGSLEHRDAEINIPRNESIAIFLKNALDRFTREKHMSIKFHKI